MQIVQGFYPIVKKTAAAREIYDIEVSCPPLAQRAKAGQFVHVKPGRGEEFMLRRPISLCEISRERGTVRLVFEVRGEGTRLLSQLGCGDLVDLMGPLGNGFTLPEEKTKKAVVVGGGIGVPPMLQLARQFGKNAAAVLGFRSASAAILEEDFKACGGPLFLCTDDGSKGRKGFVTQALTELLKDWPAEIIYACGPSKMLEAVGKIAAENGIACQVSLEERMACGVGACLGCACKVRRDDGSETYLHVCKDGPVFDEPRVVWGD